MADKPETLKDIYGDTFFMMVTYGRAESGDMFYTRHGRNILLDMANKFFDMLCSTNECYKGENEIPSHVSIVVDDFYQRLNKQAEEFESGD